MRIVVLAENTASSDEYGAEHGLSLYIETKKHRLLFDTGASGLFAENAEKLGVELAGVDAAFISHGHYDHGGGLKTFLGLNSAARAYLHKEAFGGHFADRPGGVRAYIGLDKTLRSNERLIFCGDYLKIDEELEIFSAVSGSLHSPSGNADLLRYESGKYGADDFRHEQNLIISENGRYCLITGCAHRGIINIIDRFREIKGRSPDYVVGGFHMYNKSRGESEAPEIVKEIGGLLAGYDNVSYHTCHCTGTEAYNALKNVMGGRISHISTGNKIIF